mmetsp:Transcript_38494/g.124287  ORF Transcript_38494/g.124287 Transcript_38494/m.124287 type:complete len:279 (+) Transcript_38494:424-1260(+)
MTSTSRPNYAFLDSASPAPRPSRPQWRSASAGGRSQGPPDTSRRVTSRGTSRRWKRGLRAARSAWMTSEEASGPSRRCRRPAFSLVRPSSATCSRAAPTRSCACARSTAPRGAPARSAAPPRGPSSRATSRSSARSESRVRWSGCAARRARAAAPRGCVTRPRRRSLSSTRAPPAPWRARRWRTPAQRRARERWAEGRWRLRRRHRRRRHRRRRRRKKARRWARARATWRARRRWLRRRRRRWMPRIARVSTLACHSCPAGGSETRCCTSSYASTTSH